MVAGLPRVFAASLTAGGMDADAVAAFVQMQDTYYTPPNILGIVLSEETSPTTPYSSQANVQIETGVTSPNGIQEAPVRGYWGVADGSQFPLVPMPSNMPGTVQP